MPDHPDRWEARLRWLLEHCTVTYAPLDGHARGVVRVETIAQLDRLMRGAPPADTTR